MVNSDIVKKLTSLVHLDIDAVHAYGQAISHLNVESVRQQVSQFQADHQRHISDLSAIIQQLGGTPPTYSRDFKGYLIEGFTAIKSATGSKGAVEALRQAEKLTNKSYEDATQWDVPANVKDVINRNYDDERRHLAYVERVLADTNLWQTQTTRGV